MGTYRFSRKPEEREQIEQVFNSYLAEAFEQAKEIMLDRGKGYNYDVSIVDYFPHGEQDIIYELFKKLLRTENAMKAEHDGADVDGRVEDGIIDSINYQAILFAYYRMRKEGII